MPILKNMFNDIFGSLSNLSKENIIIKRFCYAPEGTFGHLTYKEFSAFTVEQPWNNNNPYHSCIPDGMYNAVWHNSAKFGSTLAVTGGTVSIKPSPLTERSHILFHVGNWPSDFEGCIGLGKSFTCISGKLGVSSSRDTVNEFLDLCRGEDKIPLYILQKAGTFYE